jgi:hypothetical protein
MTMLRTLAALAALGMLTGTAMAATPSAEQRDDFYGTCMAISQNEPLCSCKADAALTLVDAEFMAVIIAAMKGKTPPDEYAVPYNDYIAESTRACGMGM